MNNKKIIVLLIGICLIIAGVFSFTKKRTALAPVVENQTETEVTNPNTNTENNPRVPPISPVPNTQKPTQLTESQALEIAKKSCIKTGDSLGSGGHNDITHTWWFDVTLHNTPALCNPACVVNDDTKLAEINWRCTGAITTSRLTDKKWMWVRTENSDKTVTTPNKPDIFGITFTADNHVALATDCNGVGGDYTTTGNTNAITINGLISTLMYCENSEESIFSGMIQNVASYSFPNTGGLELMLKNNGGKMIFK